MRLAFRPVAGVTRVKMGFVDDLRLAGRNASVSFSSIFALTDTMPQSSLRQ